MRRLSRTGTLFALASVCLVVGVGAPAGATNATAPKPGILFNIGGTSGNVHEGTARGALPTFIFLVNNTKLTITGIHLEVHLPGQKLLVAGVKATPKFSTPVKQTKAKAGNDVIFTLPPLKPRTSLTFTTRAVVLKVKLGRFCPGYAVFTAPGWKTTKQPITCFTVTP